MCGITGIIYFKPKDCKKFVKTLKNMTDILNHRGPDDSGFFIANSSSRKFSNSLNRVSGNFDVAFGHRRLSILDLSKKGKQPMSNRNKNLWIIFNGEIYNYLELREELKLKGYKFKTGTDTEVILAAYQEWGTNCFNRFNGMWAIALYDVKNKKVIFSRDRFGVKPFYYFMDKEKIIFGSEIKSILAYPNLNVKPNYKVIYDYLKTGLLDHTNETFFDGIKKLSGSSYAIVDFKSMKISKYWQLKTRGILGEPIKSFRDLFTDSINLRLRSDVPVGTCLSGGIDSSSVVCVFNNLLYKFKDKNSRRGLQKTFSACFNNKDIDERKYIEECLSKTNAEKNYVFPDSKGLWKDLNDLIYVQEEPFGSTSIYSQYNVMRLANKKVKVLLDGQGSDELLAGYIPYIKSYIISLIKKGKFFTALRECLLTLDITLPFFMNYIKTSKKNRIMNLMCGPFFNNSIVDNSLNKWGTSSLKDTLGADFSSLSLPALLRYEDKNSMAFSIETRLPFLDYRLVEYVFSLDDTYKIHNGWTKYILRRAMKNLVPSKILRRRKKLGFATPEVIWLRELKSEIRNVFVSDKFAKRGLFNQSLVLSEFDKFVKGNKDHYYPLFWRLLCLEIWFRVWIDKRL